MSIYIDLKDNGLEKVHYNYTQYPSYIHYNFLSEYPNYAAPPHWHDDIEFIYVLSGEMSYNINGEIIMLKSEEGIFINSRQIHFGFSKEYKECEFICILLHPMLLCLNPEIEQDYVNPVLQNQNLPYIHFTHEIEWNREIMEGIYKIYSIESAPASILKIQSIFTWMWALIYEHMPKLCNIKKTKNNNLSILKNMISFIQQYYDQKITLQQIAESGGVGQSKCCKLFKTYLYQTPNTYLISYRLNKSITLLCNTDITITEIAYIVGFNGSSYYAEAFRRYFNISPTEYRHNFAFEK